MREPETQFINRKKEHIELALQNENEASESLSLNRVTLVHDSLPQLNLADVSIESKFFDQTLATPFFIAGMTAGHTDADVVNSRLAELAAARGWILGVGSQRREIDNEFIDEATAGLVARFPNLKLVANLGIAQLTRLHHENKFSDLFKLLDRMHATLVAIHLNPLQEAIQQEGTANFAGSLAALSSFANQSPVPVVVKETGCGMSDTTLEKLAQLKLFAVDVSGLGGTHWGRIEGKRASADSIAAILGETFANWGVSTVESLFHASNLLPKRIERWASGGVRNGLDAAKLFALGSTRVGFAKPALQKALESPTALNHWMETCETELKVALFCTNSARISDLDTTKITIDGINIDG